MIAARRTSLQLLDYAPLKLHVEPLSLCAIAMPEDRAIMTPPFVGRNATMRDQVFIRLSGIISPYKLPLSVPEKVSLSLD